MQIGKQEVAKIADLARLEIEDARLEMFSAQLSNILEYMEKLNQLDTSAVEPLYSPVEHATAFRDDTPADDYTRQEVLQNAPETDGAFFIVPRII